MGNTVSQQQLTDALTPYAKKTDVTNLQSGLSSYALESELSNYQPIGNYALSSDLTSLQPKGNYALSTDLSTLQQKGNYALSTDLAGLQPKGNYALTTDLTTAITNNNTLLKSSTVSCPSDGSVCNIPAANYNPICRPVSTPLNSDGGGNIIFMDRHTLSCSTDEYLNSFHIQRGVDASGAQNQIQLTGTCCKIWNKSS